MNRIIAYWLLVVDAAVFIAQHALPPRQAITTIAAVVHLGVIVLALVVAYPERVMPFLALVASVVPSIRFSRKGKEEPGDQ